MYSVVCVRARLKRRPCLRCGYFFARCVRVCSSVRFPSLATTLPVFCVVLLNLFVSRRVPCDPLPLTRQACCVVSLRLRTRGIMHSVHVCVYVVTTSRMKGISSHLSRELQERVWDEHVLWYMAATQSQFGVVFRSMFRVTGGNQLRCARRVFIVMSFFFSFFALVSHVTPATAGRVPVRAVFVEPEGV